jgi:hypothetical protein
VQWIKSCRRRLHHPEKLTSGPRIAASMEKAKSKPAICAGRARIWAKAQLSPTLRPTTMCCPPMRNLVDDLADRIVQADVGRVPILDRRNSKVVGLVARRDRSVCALASCERRVSAPFVAVAAPRCERS